MLSTKRVSGISANNIIAGKVAGIRADHGPYVDVRLDCAGMALLARITRMSQSRLGITEGAKVWALVKSVSVERTPSRQDGARS